MGNKERATCFATLLQNKLNSDVAHFTTHIKPVLQQIRLLTGLMWVVKCMTICYSTRFAAVLQNKLQCFLLPVFPYLKREFIFNNVWYNIIFCCCSFRTGKGLGYSAHFSGPMLVLESAVKTGKRENKVLHHLVKFEFHPQKVKYNSPASN